MIDRDKARRLVSSFSGTVKYPDTPEGLTALIDAFQNASENANHAEQVADDLRVDTSFCPTPAEIWRSAKGSRPDREPIVCELCNGTGWRPVVKGGVEAVERCEH